MAMMATPGMLILVGWSRVATGISGKFGLVQKRSSRLFAEYEVSRERTMVEGPPGIICVCKCTFEQNALGSAALHVLLSIRSTVLSSVLSSVLFGRHTATLGQFLVEPRGL